MAKRQSCLYREAWKITYVHRRTPTVPTQTSTVRREYTIECPFFVNLARLNKEVSFMERFRFG